jgi:hypothetical protein
MQKAKSKEKEPVRAVHTSTTRGTPPLVNSSLVNQDFISVRRRRQQRLCQRGDPGVRVKLTPCSLLGLLVINYDL